MNWCLHILLKYNKIFFQLGHFFTLKKKIIDFFLLIYIYFFILFQSLICLCLFLCISFPAFFNVLFFLFLKFFAFWLLLKWFSLFISFFLFLFFSPFSFRWWFLALFLVSSHLSLLGLFILSFFPSFLFLSVSAGFFLQICFPWSLSDRPREVAPWREEDSRIYHVDSAADSTVRFFSSHFLACLEDGVSARGQPWYVRAGARTLDLSFSSEPPLSTQAPQMLAQTLIIWRWSTAAHWFRLLQPIQNTELLFNLQKFSRTTALLLYTDVPLQSQQHASTHLPSSLSSTTWCRHSASMEDQSSSLSSNQVLERTSPDCPLHLPSPALLPTHLKINSIRSSVFVSVNTIQHQALTTQVFRNNRTFNE